MSRRTLLEDKRYSLGENRKVNRIGIWRKFLNESIDYDGRGPDGEKYSDLFNKAQEDVDEQLARFKPMLDKQAKL